MRLAGPCSLVLLLFCFLGLSSGGCSYTFDSGPLDVPVIGEPLLLSQLVRIPGLRLSVPQQGIVDPPAQLVQGEDGSPWVLSLQQNQLRAVSLERPEDVLEMQDDELQPVGLTRYLFLRKPGSGTAGRLTLLALGRPPRVVPLPPEDDRVQMIDGGAVSWQAQNAAAGLHVVLWNRDDSVSTRTLTWPAGIAPRGMGWVSVLRDPEPYALLVKANDERAVLCLLEDGANIDLGWVELKGSVKRSVLYTDLRGNLFAYFVTQRVERPLGKDLPGGALRLVFADPTGRGLALCSSLGLWAADLDAATGSPSASLRVLDPAPCGWMSFVNKSVLRYQHAIGQLGQEIRVYQVPFDGSEPPILEPPPPRPADLPEGALVLSSCSGVLAYSLGQGEPWASHDIVVRGRRISERGQSPRFSYDCSRLRWYEHSEEAPGELLSTRISDEQDQGKLRLGRNVVLSRELPDGRVLVASSVFPSGDTRLVVVDEERAQAVLLLRTDSPINDATTASERGAGPWDHRVVLDVGSPNGEPSLAVLPVPPR